MQTTHINVRSDIETKSKAQEIFASLGLDMSTAINLFLRQTVRQKDIPFVITMNPIKSKRTMAETMGCMRGEYKIADDFDAPLEDFKEYME